MRANHRLGIAETLVLGQACLGAALVASTLKAEQRLVLSVQCSGPAEGFTVEARTNTDGKDRILSIGLRGWIFNPDIQVDRPPESFDTAPLVGSGSLTLIRHSPDASQSFTGTVALHSGRLSQDLAVYFLESEQTHTAFRFGIQFDHEGRLIGAGGVYLQALPGALESTLSRAEEQLAILPSPGAWFAGGRSLEELAAGPFMLFDPAPGDTIGLDFSCHCSRSLVASFLASSQESFLEEMAVHGPWPIGTTCHNCGSVFEFSQKEIQEMLERARARG
jgi:molecular chaperone Hsp33